MIHTGATRMVLLIGKFAFKFPHIWHGHKHFIAGCYHNWNERNYYKLHRKVMYETNMTPHACPSFFCFTFGLLQIQARCKPNEVELTEEQKKFYMPLSDGDDKARNFGWYKGKLVCLDYGNS